MGNFWHRNAFGGGKAPVFYRFHQPDALPLPVHRVTTRWASHKVTTGQGTTIALSWYIVDERERSGVESEFEFVSKNLHTRTRLWTLIYGHKISTTPSQFIGGITWHHQVEYRPIYNFTIAIIITAATSEDHFSSWKFTKSYWNSYLLLYRDTIIPMELEIDWSSCFLFYTQLPHNERRAF